MPLRAFPRLSSKLKFSVSAISRGHAIMVCMGVTCAADIWELKKQDEVVVIRKEVSTDEAAESMGKYQERIEKERKWLVMLKGKDENIIPLLGCYMLNDKASFCSSAWK